MKSQIELIFFIVKFFSSAREEKKIIFFSWLLMLFSSAGASPPKSHITPEIESKQIMEIFNSGTLINYLTVNACSLSADVIYSFLIYKGYIGSQVEIAERKKAISDFRSPVRYFTPSNIKKIFVYQNLAYVLIPSAANTLWGTLHPLLSEKNDCSDSIVTLGSFLTSSYFLTLYFTYQKPAHYTYLIKQWLGGVIGTYIYQNHGVFAVVTSVTLGMLMDICRMNTMGW